MASTVNLQATIQWAAAFLKYQPQQIGGPDPAVTAANIVLQTILGPPFKWNWNRTSVTITCVAGTQDYITEVDDFHFLEKVSLVTPGSSGRKVQIEISEVLADSSDVAPPTTIAAQEDDGEGNITFRFLPPPDKAYTAIAIYQSVPELMTSAANTWAPIPDRFGYIYNWGYMAAIGMLTNDARFPIWERNFLSRLLGAQSGLTELERSIFLQDWQRVTMQVQGNSQRLQQGVASRQI